MGIISYGIGTEYLSSWGIKQALREIYQNYLDYGDFSEIVTEDENKVFVNISNNYIPENLEFLKIGKSVKHNENAIGKHGEGLKMAFLIFHREGLNIKIQTNQYTITPKFKESPQIGKCLHIQYRKRSKEGEHFTTSFECDKEIFEDFRKGIISKEDYTFTNSYHGSIVDRPAGEIYSGKLFVCKLENFSKSYDIPPSLLPLDRDREVPRAFDVNYHSSRINENQKEWTAKDLTYSDTSYIQSIPKKIKEQITPKLVGNSIEYTTEVEGETKVITNDSVKEALSKDSFFVNIIKKLKMAIAKKLGIYDLLLEFQKKHYLTGDAKIDLELIIEKAKTI